LAERLFRRAAHGRHESRSAGSRPGESVHPGVLEALIEVDIDASDHVPRALAAADVDWADVVVARATAHAHVPGKPYLSWTLADPTDRSLDEVRAIRDDIDRRVNDLVARLDLGPL
jgi:arsenate reductase